MNETNLSNEMFGKSTRPHYWLIKRRLDVLFHDFKYKDCHRILQLSQILIGTNYCEIPPFKISKTTFLGIPD